MNTQKNRNLAGFAVLGILAAALGLSTVACHSAQNSAGAEADIPVFPISERGGAQLWGDNCSRCHNARTPTEFSDPQWEIVAHHMRVRANLTAYEHEKILQFLKSGN